jgi:hypothetical protein
MTNEEILAQPNHLERRALMALNILREAAGLDDWRAVDNGRAR